jgi:long-chain acyl-CoA synthetase
VVYWLGSAVFRLFYQVRIEGKQHVSCSGACLLAPNHTSYLDPIVLAHALGLKNLNHTYWAGLSTVAFNNAFKRFMCRLGQAVPITPEHGAVSGLAFASAILKRNQRLVWFPEGRRSLDGKLQTFKPGLGTVLKRIPVPVIPVWIEGTYAAWPVARRFPRPGRIRVIFGEAVDVHALQNAGSSDKVEWNIMQGLHQRLAELGQD